MQAKEFFLHRRFLAEKFFSAAMMAIYMHLMHGRVILNGFPPLGTSSVHRRLYRKTLDLFLLALNSDSGANAEASPHLISRPASAFGATTKCRILHTPLLYTLKSIAK